MRFEIRDKLHFLVEKEVPDDLDADQHQHGGQAHLQVDEPVHRSRQHEIHRAQAEDGKDVRGVNDEGVARDGEDGRHAVDGEDHVGDFDGDQGEEKRRGVEHHFPRRVRLADEEVVVGDGRRHRHEPLHEADDPARIRRRMRLPDRAQHLPAAEDQDRREDVEHPGQLRDDHRACADEQRPEHDRAHDAPEQHAVLVGRRHGEERHDHRDDEDIVERQRRLEHVARQILHRRLCPQVAAIGIVGRIRLVEEIHIAREGQRTRCKACPHQRALACGYLAVLLVDHRQVEPQHEGDCGEEGRPQPGRLAGEFGGKIERHGSALLAMRQRWGEAEAMAAGAPPVSASRNRRSGAHACAGRTACACARRHHRR